MSQLLNKKAALKKWDSVVEAQKLDESVPEILGKGKKALIAQMLENQHKDSKQDSIYKDEKLIETFSSVLSGGQLDEAVVAGDHGYDPTNIAAGQTSGAITNIGPAVMGMARRSIPQLMTFDVAGTQPLSSPTGSVFTLRSMYGADPLASGAREAFHPMNAPDSMYSGRGASETFSAFSATAIYETGNIFKIDFDAVERVQGTVSEDVPQSGVHYYQLVVDEDLTMNTDDVYTTFISLLTTGKIAPISAGMATSIAELQEGFNGSENNPWNEMSFRIDKQTVEAKSRQLKAQYSIELAQDLKAVHGLDADVQLSNILSSEIVLEINREMVNTINAQAQVGKTGWTNLHGGAAGVFDLQDSVDVKGARWAGEAYKMLLMQIDKEANEVGRQTGRGNANFIIASRNVVSAFSQTQTMVGGSAIGMQQGMNTDTNGSVFAGILAGKYRVYIDQYAQHDYFTVGYKGTDEMDAGIYYSPYVALTPLRGSDSKNMQPVLGFKSRYAFSVNPLANPAKAPNKITQGGIHPEQFGRNAYFRRVWVKGI